MNVQRRFVSVWVGNADSAQALEDCLKFSYTDDGDTIPCAFGRDFPWFDEDYLEAAVKDRPSQSWRTLLAGNSDGTEIASALTRRAGESLAFEAQAVVLLYQFKYDGSVKSVDRGPVQFRFMGTVAY